MDKLGVVCGVVKGNWRREMFVTVRVGPGEEITYSWEGTQAALTSHYFISTDDVLEKLPSNTDNIDWFTAVELWWNHFRQTRLLAAMPTRWI